MREYVRERLAEIGVAPPIKRRARSITKRPKPTTLQNDQLSYFANLYIRTQRRKKPDCSATWFDVHDAYKAGYEAAQLVHEVRARINTEAR